MSAIEQAIKLIEDEISKLKSAIKVLKGIDISKEDKPIEYEIKQEKTSRYILPHDENLHALFDKEYKAGSIYYDILYVLNMSGRAMYLREIYEVLMQLNPKKYKSSKTGAVPSYIKNLFDEEMYHNFNPDEVGGYFKVQETIKGAKAISISDYVKKKYLQWTPTINQRYDRKRQGTIKS